MSPPYKLTYFDIMGLAEPIRLLLSYGNLDFEDCRVPKESWPNIKPNMPFGQIPVLEFNGKVYHQSIAISRYLAKQVKLVGKDDIEDMEIDAIVDVLMDFRSKVAKYHYDGDEAAKEAYAKTLFGEIVPYYLEKLDKQAKENGGYLVGGKLTWADLILVGSIDYMNFMAKKELLAGAPNLLKVKENVAAVPNKKMQQPLPSLTYFAVPGLAEPIRWLLAYGDYEYLENSISFDIWGDYKESTPAGQLPIFKVKGKVLHQSMAISRFLGTIQNLAGNTPMENWEIDAAVDTVTDLRLKIVAWSVETDPERKDRLAYTLQNEFLPEFLGNLERQAEKNHGHLALKKITWADIVFAATDHFLSDVYTSAFGGTELLSGYPNLLSIVRSVRNIPTIKRLAQQNLKIKFVTNTTKESKRILHDRLTNLGFTVNKNDILSSLGACRNLIEKNNLKPMLMIAPDALEDFEGLACPRNETPNAVVIGLAPTEFNYARLNEAFRYLQNGAQLIAIHAGKYYKSSDGMSLGPGCFVKGLEYSAQCSATLVGKPNKLFFQSPLDEDVKPAEAIMIGDDVTDDVKGAMDAGLRGYLVKTGKYREGDESKISPAPTAVFSSFVEAADKIIEQLTQKTVYCT
ncbi:hypothetical protein HUJ05_004565 [Dendroctonus ponderosae]|nr:hypothetical protein HUJ05_004565 [Dendroctonus ponderosae]